MQCALMFLTCWKSTFFRLSWWLSLQVFFPKYSLKYGRLVRSLCLFILCCVVANLLCDMSIGTELWCQGDSGMFLRFFSQILDGLTQQTLILIPKHYLLNYMFFIVQSPHRCMNGWMNLLLVNVTMPALIISAQRWVILCLYCIFMMHYGM